MSTLTPGIYDATPVEFPNLFTETVRPTIASIMVFAFADLRRIAREETEHGSNDSLKVLDLPMSGRDMIKVCLENLELIKQKVRPSHYKIVNYLLSNDFMEAHGKEVSSIDHVLIHYCGDDNELNECVHTIAANSKTKQITLSFRGSITMQDWLHDAELVIGDVANPLYDDKDDKSKDQPEYLGVHLGFRDYLYDVKDPLLRTIRLNEMQSKMNRFLAGNKDSSSAKREPEKTCNDDNKETTQQVPAHANEGQKGSHQPLHKIQSKVTEEIIKVNEEITKLKVKMVSKEVSQEMEPPKNKIDTILDQVQVLLDANPGYKLYITGHSLGGALALLTSVQASVRFARPGIPVTCVTIANPRVGDNRFRGAIQSLEQNKMLRLLTVHNSLDLVPSMPNRLCRCDFCRPNKFCMPGIIMILKKRSFSITYHSATNDTRWEELKGEFQRLLIVIFCFYQMGLSHDYRMYLDRLVAEKDKLTKMYLNDLYREQGIDFDK